ncbi:MAG TPA: hypothetical protein VGX92_12455 [Pyrinomonadaceae bacterium]|nr:hypothetical protein [Pyrinomonadaceae bacterium]
MSVSFERPSSAGGDDDDDDLAALPDGLKPSQAAPQSLLSLAGLPVGARLILRCRKDWRDATIVAVTLEQVTLSVGTPKGRTYRVRRPGSTPVIQDGPVMVVGGEGSWRTGLVRYDARW